MSNQTTTNSFNSDKGKFKKHFSNKAIYLFLLSVIGLCGCSEFKHGKLDFSKGSLIGTELTYNYLKPQTTNYYKKIYQSAGDDTKQKLIRNRMVIEVMGVIDLDFDRFAKSLRTDRAYKEIIVQLTSLGLTGAGSLAGQSTANILSAIDTGLKGANDAVNLHAWANDAPEIIINKMEALREPIRAQIYTNLTKSVANYPLEAAELDLGHFYKAASVTAALTALNASTGEQARTAKEESTKAKAASQDKEH